MLGLLALPACSKYFPPDPDAAVPVDAGAPPDGAIQPPQELARLFVLRAARWPGGGREFTLGVLDDKTGRPFAADLSARISVVPPLDQDVKFVASRRVPAPGYTAVLLPPSQSAAERAVVAQAVLDFAAGRPAERVALYRHGAAVQLFSGFVPGTAELAQALARYQAGADDEDPLSVDKAAASVIADLKQVGGEGPDVMRALVVLSHSPSKVDVRSKDVFVVAVQPDALGLATAGAAIEDVQKSAIYRVAVCSKTDKFDGWLRVADLRGDLKTTFASTLPEEVDAACDVASIDSATRTFTPRIELVFDDEQRAAHAERVAAATKTPYNVPLAKSDFTTQVRLAPGQPTILATAHLHGNGTLYCARKSYTLSLDGAARRLMPDSATDEYVLISMCDDRAYMYGATAYDLYSNDLFPVKHRFVEFVIDGQTRGIYLMLEKPSDALVAAHARVTTVMRRGYPASGRDAFEVAYSSTGDLVAPLASYAAFEAQIAGLSGDALVAALDEKLDLDKYLQWLASQSVLQSGDYVDETFLIGTEQADGQGAIGETYRFMPWDPEGYTTCHSGGANAYMDTYQMAYCAEARLDARLLPDPVIYERFVTKLEEALSGALARDKMRAALTRTRTALQGWLMDPAICAAMIELKAIDSRAADCAVARSVVEARANALLTAYDNRRSLLLSRIAAYRAMP